MDNNEKQIVERFIKGDESAFEILFHKYYPGLCIYANKIMFNHYMAEEIVSDTFVNTWEKRNTIKSDISIKYYLFRAVLNNCLNYIKHQKVEQEYIQSNSHNVKFAEKIEDNSQAELIKYFLIYLEELPAQCKNVFKMSRLEGLKYKEIAMELGISIKTVEVHIQKALKYLRTKLKDKKNILLILVLYLLA